MAVPMNCHVYPEGRSDESGADEPYCTAHLTSNGHVLHEMSNGLYRVHGDYGYIDSVRSTTEAVELTTALTT